MKEIKKEIILEGEEECINKILSFLRLLSYNGSVGHSGHFWISLDGDGQERPKLKIDSGFMMKIGGYGEIPHGLAMKLRELKNINNMLENTQHKKWDGFKWIDTEVKNDDTPKA